MSNSNIIKSSLEYYDIYQSKEIKENLKNIITRIYDENFNNNDYFNFSLTKSKKEEEVLQTENV